MFTEEKNKQYESPSIKTIELENESVLCASFDLPDGYNEENW